ncbi:type I pantothenate kinase [Effusibacillus pohliae]|uniref:type I pantothenate kinase n=1 Tax=Effusibacillus pohliae TaxID=232270 RepID=UPI00036407FD|nr:type I pantothenate kinase [Effusibacillus pohliae]
MITKLANETKFSPFLTFTREEWRELCEVPFHSLSEEELEKLRGLNETISLKEIQEIYHPLSKLLNLYVAATQELHKSTNTFLGSNSEKVPYVIGIAGSVAVGKSTTARVLQALLARWPNHPKVDLVTTDGFLYPNAVLEKRGLMKRKGFPESYDIRRLIQFLADIKSGVAEVACPVYSHLAYDIVPNERQVIRRPDILIVEGLNVLQVASGDGEPGYAPKVYVSDFFDFSIYVDADESDIEHWYVERFKLLRNTAFQNPNSYFHRYAGLTDPEAVEIARHIWREINYVNLWTNILPTRNRARLIMTKSSDHSVQTIKLRKL